MSGAREYREYVVAALLHDVGKLIRRAKLCSGEGAKRHVEHSVEFVEMLSNVLRKAGLDVDLVKRLVERHHEGGFGIAPYDRAAALERMPGDEDSGRGLAIPGRGEHQIPLLVYGPEGEELYVPPCPLPDTLDEAEALKPCRGANCLPPEAVCACYKKAYSELMRLAGELDKLELSYPQLVETLIHVLKTTTIFVPAAVYGVEKPDTSLFAHSILAAALASTGGEFVLASIDVGRIQEYIARARTVMWAMSILRGRSLRITLLQKLAARRLIEEVNKILGGDVVTHANILIDTGGEVLLILPKIEGLDKIAEKIEEELLEESEGQLALYINFTGPYKLEDIAKFRDIATAHFRSNIERKLRFRLFPKLTQLKEANARSQHGAYKFHNHTCEFCGRPAKIEKVEREGAEESMELCPLCKEEFHIGLAARNLRAVIITKDLDLEKIRVAGCSLSKMKALGFDVVYAGGDCDPAQLAFLARGGALYAVNTRRFIAGAPGTAYGFIYTNQHIPKDEFGPASLQEIEELKAAAAFVKLDANAMGARKSRALERPTLLITFSTAVSMAYELYPALLADTSRYRERVYVIYSGGDDGILAGDLSALGYVAKVAEYAEAWGFHTAIGVKIGPYNYPVYYAFTETEERLEEAKELDRRSSIAVLAEIPTPWGRPKTAVYVDAKTLWDIYNRAESQELVYEDKELDRASRIIYAKLLELRKAAELCGENDLAARRTAAKALIELGYFINRRGDEATRIMEITSLPADPAQFAKFYAPLLKCDRQKLPALVAELNKGIVTINLLHLKSKSRVSRSPTS
ncbi:type III-A CRISPR-associated protein Cas10/Csm1 [Pyrobaculum sp.]|uniref:type III-A CRISPR-associated protein Cas10/Csm1 n=1 Tax=Pyrobaculum sp. TaxID=2004705 RepID=UPI003179F9FD